MIPDNGWIKEWMPKRDRLESDVDFDEYFNSDEIEIKRIGLCHLPSGEVLVRDPFNYLSKKDELPYFVTAPVGKYPVEVESNTSLSSV